MPRRIRLAIHQPNFIPRLKILQKLASADVWCVLDSVQYCPREWQNRARIVQAHGSNETVYLSVPVHRPFGRRSTIDQVRLASPGSAAFEVRRTLHSSLRSAPHWPDVERLLSATGFAPETDRLNNLCIGSTCALLDIAGRRPELVIASQLPVCGKASRLVAAIARHLKAATYLADSGGRRYLVPDDFAGIDVVWQDWAEPVEACPGRTSWRDLASINYLAWAGSERFREHLNAGDFTVDPTWVPSAPQLTVLPVATS